MLLTFFLFISSLVSRLQSIPEVENVEIHTYEQIIPQKINPERRHYYDSARAIYSEYLSLTIRQPLDHTNPSLGSFAQRVELQITDPILPVVVTTEGYSRPDTMQMKIDPIALHLHANTISVEHRYFGGSIPDDTLFTFLNTYQSAADLHTVYSVLKSVFPASWLATGTSKSGITTALYAYYFPGDMQLYVPFMAPFCISRRDERVGEYITHCAGTSEQRAVVHKAKQYAFEHLPEIARVVCHRQDCDSLMKTDSALVYENLHWQILEHFFHNWSYTPVSKGWVEKIPTDSVSADSLVNYYIGLPESKKMKAYEPIGLHADVNKRTYPYYVQAMQQLGHYIHDVEPYRHYGVTEEAYTIEKQVSEQDISRIGDIPFDDSVMRGIVNDFLPQTSCRMIFVYGANDPWTGAGMPDSIAQINPNISYYLIKDGVHSPMLSTYADQTQVDSLLKEIDKVMRPKNMCGMCKHDSCRKCSKHRCRKKSCLSK